MIDKKAIQRELVHRELARRHLREYITYTMPSYTMTATLGNRHIHNEIINTLENVYFGKIKRLMVFIRPRMGKSEIVSKRFPAWVLGQDPKKNIIVSSYGSELASDFGRKTRQIVQSQEHMNIFPNFSLSKDKNEGGNWETSLGGGYYSVGVGGALTGKGGDILIVDDPIKNREEAESPTYQQKVIDWYTSTLYTRGQSQNSAIIIMMTRWNKNDLAGYLLAEQNNGGDQWHVLSIPSIDADGNTIIWPGKWDKGYIESEKNNVSPKDWAALYQQDPIASSSNIFDLSKLRYYLLSDFDGKIDKKDLRVILCIDPAFSSSSSSDDAVVIAIGRHKISGDYYLLDGYADTSAPSNTYIAILSMYDRLLLDGFLVDYISIEDVSINVNQTRFIENFKKFMKEKGRYAVVNSYRPEGKKEDRIKFIIEPKISMSAIILPRDLLDKTFIRRLETQLSDFPHNRHDDIIDCLTQGLYILDNFETNTTQKIQIQGKRF